MKKIYALGVAMSALTITSVSAQTAIETSKCCDNWSLGLKGGAVTPMHHAAFFGDMRGVVGIELQKNITPVWGMGIEGQWSVNTSGWSRFPHSATVFDHQLLGTYTTFNLMNAFGGYTATPRVFEINLEAGVGWLHAFQTDHKNFMETNGAASLNSWYTKFGPDFNFNLGKNRAWTISIKPAFVYNMNFPGSTGYNINHGYFEIMAGVTYHFKNSNGTHSFKKINVGDYLDEIAMLKEENYALRNREPEVVEKVVEVEKVVVNEVENPVTYIGNAIGFDINSAYVAPTDYASLENIANWMKENPEAIVNVVGYADKDTGTADYNMTLSKMRSEAVKKILVDNFGINANRLNIVPMGSNTQVYSTNNYNRVVLFQAND